MLLTFGCLDNIQILFDSRKFRISVFYIREHIQLLYILQNIVEKGIVYFFLQIVFRAILLLTLRCLNFIQIYFDSCKIRILVFYMGEHIELVYILQTVQKRALYIFPLQIILRAILLLSLGFLDNIQIFVDLRKFRISVFYLRKYIQLVYILQNSVESGIVYLL